MTRVGHEERMNGSTLSGLPRLSAGKIDSSFFHGELARDIIPQSLNVSYCRRIR